VNLTPRVTNWTLHQGSPIEPYTKVTNRTLHQGSPIEPYTEVTNRTLHQGHQLNLTPRSPIEPYTKVTNWTLHQGSPIEPYTKGHQLNLTPRVTNWILHQGSPIEPYTKGQQLNLTPRVTNPHSVRLYYAARGHICVLCVSYKITRMFRQLGITYCYFPTCGPQTGPQLRVWPSALKRLDTHDLNTETLQGNRD